jgi:uncharacterized integral membrane protein
MTDLPGRSSKDTAAADARKRETRDIARVAAALVLLALLIGFVLDNSQSVKVGFVFFSSEVALIWVLLFTALLGGCLDRMLVWRKAKGRRQAGR